MRKIESDFYIIHGGGLPLIFKRKIYYFQDILLQFVVESSLLSAVGGLFGLLLAYAISSIIRRTTPIPMDITVGYVLLALAASGGVGLVFGIYPAYKASKLDPIVALSRE